MDMTSATFPPTLSSSDTEVRMYEKKTVRRTKSKLLVTPGFSKVTTSIMLTIPMAAKSRVLRKGLCIPIMMINKSLKQLLANTILKDFEVDSYYELHRQAFIPNRPRYGALVLLEVTIDALVNSKEMSRIDDEAERLGELDKHKQEKQKTKRTVARATRNSSKKMSKEEEEELSKGMMEISYNRDRFGFTLCDCGSLAHTDCKCCARSICVACIHNYPWRNSTQPQVQREKPYVSSLYR